jgi:hypothetical protein
VHAQITGSLTSVNFKEATTSPRSGPVHARSPTARGALQQAQATLARDMAQSAQAKSTSARYQDLQNRG